MWTNILGSPAPIPMGSYYRRLEITPSKKRLPWFIDSISMYSFMLWAAPPTAIPSPNAGIPWARAALASVEAASSVGGNPRIFSYPLHHSEQL